MSSGRNTPVMRLRTAALMVVILMLVVGCSGNGGNNDEPPPDPVALITDAANRIRAVDTFRMEVRHSGADYLASVYLNPTTPADVAFRRALAQYVADNNQLQAAVNVIAAGVPLSVDVFSFGPEQWVRLAGTDWLRVDFAPGFNPETLIAEDTGFQAALAALTELEYLGAESLEDGTRTYHLRGIAKGPDVTNLLVGLIEADGLLPVDVYISRESGYPVRLVIRQPETITEDEPVPTTWTIDVFDINAEPQLTPPRAVRGL